MKRYTIHISDFAYENIKHISEFILKDSYQNAIIFSLGVVKKIQSLEFFPNSWKKLPQDVRAKVFQSHYIVYNINEKRWSVEILSVVSCKNYKAYEKYL